MGRDKTGWAGLCCSNFQRLYTAESETQKADLEGTVSSPTTYHTLLSSEAHRPSSKCCPYSIKTTQVHPWALAIWLPACPLINFSCGESSFPPLLSFPGNLTIMAEHLPLVHGTVDPIHSTGRKQESKTILTNTHNLRSPILPPLLTA